MLSAIRDKLRNLVPVLATMGHPGAMDLMGDLIDLLPRGLWKPGNLHLPLSWLPVESNPSLHFCVATGNDGTTVRTVEWDGREIARGRRSFVPPDS